MALLAPQISRAVDRYGQGRVLPGVTTVGVTSGASVPEILVTGVLERLAEYGYDTVQPVTTANETLVFTGERTLESQHGKPTRMFLEVAPQKVACNHPLMPNAQCLQTREVTFNEQGLRVGEPGPWQVFQGDIQGFNFEPGYRSVLRVDRFTRANPPADASRYIFVLDMQVETARVAK